MLAEALKEASQYMTPMDYMGFAVVLIGLGFLLGQWVYRLTERPLLVLLVDVLRDIQRADRWQGWLSTELRARVDRLIGERSFEEEGRRRPTEERGYGPEEIITAKPPTAEAIARGKRP